ncbi:MAG: prepilin-type N-terminal cleavage/methylation domain-containing protein [Armatimonadetes bacterium]|nr:prepilin-type N-terminal cleavage/methylation domain-containing protein [Armatimonadota bacterium]
MSFWWKKIWREQKGFTLLELVLAVGIASALILPAASLLLLHMRADSVVQQRALPVLALPVCLDNEDYLGSVTGDVFARLKEDVNEASELFGGGTWLNTSEGVTWSLNGANLVRTDGDGPTTELRNVSAANFTVDESGEYERVEVSVTLQTVAGGRTFTFQTAAACRRK